MERVNSSIVHRTERIPDILRNEIYELDDIVYTVSYDDLTGKRLYGHVDMFNGVRVCSVQEDGSICLTMPTEWVMNHKGMLHIINDIKRLDEFLTAVVDNYK